MTACDFYVELLADIWLNINIGLCLFPSSKQQVLTLTIILAFVCILFYLFLLSYSRIESQDYFYREIVVPRLRNSLRPILDPEIIKIKKQC
jgi:hypothetical protein